MPVLPPLVVYPLSALVMMKEIEKEEKERVENKKESDKAEFHNRSFKNHKGGFFFYFAYKSYLQEGGGKDYILRMIRRG